MNTNKIIEKAKESYDRYFKDAPVFPENHEQDVVCNAEEIEKIIDKKKAQLDGHVENLNALKKEIEVTATDKLNKTFTDDAAEYAKKAVNQMLADYEEETNRIADLKKKLAALKKKYQMNSGIFSYSKFIHTILHCKGIYLYTLFTIKKMLLSSSKFLIMIQL